MALFALFFAILIVATSLGVLVFMYAAVDILGDIIG